MDCLPPVHKSVCSAVENPHKWYVSSYGKLKGVKEMKREILKRGPITCTVHKSMALINYEEGIIRDSNNKVLNHEVSVVGWNADSKGQEYWIIRNSWGTYWGDYGFANIAFGSLGIEESCSWGAVEERNVRRYI